MTDLAHFAVDVLRLVLWLSILATVFAPLERLFALHPQRVWRRGIAMDLACYFLSSLLPAAVLALPLAVLAAAGQRWMPAGWLHGVAALPLPLRFVVALVVGEVGGYWGHRWAHEVPLLWRFHALHHSPEQMDWLVNSRAHPVDLVFVRLCAAAPMALLGLSQPFGGTALALAVVFATTFWGFFVHANLRWRFGVLEHILATPAFHHWHHSRSDHINRNYATMLPCIDRLFGTLYLPRHWPAAYGIDRHGPATPADPAARPLASTEGR